MLTIDAALALDVIFVLLFVMAGALVLVAITNSYYARKIGQKTGSQGPWTYIVVHCLLMIVLATMNLLVFFPSLIDNKGLDIIVLSWVVLFADGVILLVGLFQLNELFERQ